MISDAIAVRPNEGVLAWLAAQDPEELCTTAITAAELRAGAAALDPGRRRETLVEAIEKALTDDLMGRIVPFDAKASLAFAEITARRRRLGKGWSPIDMLIASIAATTSSAVATRNVYDFEESDVELIDPWTA